MDPTQPSGTSSRPERAPGNQPGSSQPATPGDANPPPPAAPGPSGQPPSPRGDPARSFVPNPPSAQQAAPANSPRRNTLEPEAPRAPSRTGSGPHYGRSASWIHQ
ncbi:hypothetical protein VTO73DRAFT_15083 [Trametes versicolor]